MEIKEEMLMAPRISDHPMGTLIGDPLPGAPELAARGSTVTGVRTILLTEREQPEVPRGLQNGKFPVYDRELQIEVWYPACPDTGTVPAVYTDHIGRADLGNLVPFLMQGRAFRDAEPDSSAGPRPVIVISHGYPGSRFLLSNLAENLSSKGYVVLSIGHRDNTYEDFAAERSLESALIHRSRDQRFVISELERMNRQGFLAGMLQPDNVGLIGFSMGGYGALRTIGARFHREAMQQFSSLAEELREADDFHGIKAVKAAVLFAPATFWLDENRLEDLDIPTLWVCGTADHTVHYDAVRCFWQNAVASDRTLVSYACCGHNVANNPAPREGLSASWEIYKRWADPVWDTWNLNNANAHFTTAFFARHLMRRTDVDRYLLPPSPSPERKDAAADLPGFVPGGSAGISLEHLSGTQG